MIKNLDQLRKDYKKMSLDIENSHSSPILQFRQWFEEALEGNVPEANAMILATADENNQPSARVVLLKGFLEEGFVFFTNYDSAKGKIIDQNPKVALVFNWLELERQVRIEGIAEKVTDAESDDYFASRPKESRIGAWVSSQSKELPSRAILEDRFSELTVLYQDNEVIPRPPYWGGYLVSPSKIEFWQGRPSRLHDRIVYERFGNGLEWKKYRLAP